MTAQGWLQIAIFVVVLTALTPLLGGYMARVYQGERVFLTPILGPVERLFYRLLRVEPNRGQDWKSYARTLIVFSVLFWVLLYVILRTQGIWPFNPAGSTPAPGTSASTPPHRSSRTPTGSTTEARRRSPTSRRWPASQSRTSSRPRSGWRCWWR